MLSAGLVSHRFDLTPRESRAYSTARPEPERPPSNLAQPQRGRLRNRLYRKGTPPPQVGFFLLNIIILIGH
jgi:hypothetical protein